MGIIWELNNISIDEIVKFIQEKAETNNIPTGDILKEVITNLRENEIYLVGKGEKRKLIATRNLELKNRKATKCSAKQS